MPIKLMSLHKRLNTTYPGQEKNLILPILNKYLKISEIQQCILDFRTIYNDKDVTLLEQSITRYSESPSNSIKSFASGLLSDLVAVKNSVTSELSNGFVEGNNNKIKTIRRIMYGRAKIDLLRVKILYSR